jgi:23S rRNA pseudouridine1911/1915/1917 synthase
MNKVYKFTVESLKVRLDKFLAENMDDISRGIIQKHIEDGLVSVNEKVVTSTSGVVRKSDEVVYHYKAPKGLEAKNIPIKTLYNNHGLLVIDKPPGLAVHPGAGLRGDSLAEALLFHFKDIAVVGEEGRPGIVHRLDKDTSGVMLVALTQDMYEYLKDAFASRKVKKHYIALVHGRLAKPRGIIDVPIGKSKTDFRKYSTKNMIEAKPSLTSYEVIEELGSGLDQYSLIMVELHTGRTHQIRVHFSSLGNPLLGDTLYGPRKKTLVKLGRQFLHACRIEIQLPSGEWIETESLLPNDLRSVLRDLGSKKVDQL